VEKIRLIVSIIFCVIIVFVFGGLCGGYYINRRWSERDNQIRREIEAERRASAERIESLEEELGSLRREQSAIINRVSELSTSNLSEIERIIELAGILLEYYGDSEVYDNSTGSNSDS